MILPLPGGESEIYNALEAREELGKFNYPDLILSNLNSLIY